MRMSDGGGASIPPGDPGAIRGAASQLSGLASQISGIRSESRGASSELVGRSWSSPAAGLFQQASGRYASDLGSVEDAVISAAGSLRTYAAALEAAQQQARTAIAAQSQAQTTAADAQNRLASQTPPSGASAQAVTAFQQQQTSVVDGHRRHPDPGDECCRRPPRWSLRPGHGFGPGVCRRTQRGSGSDGTARAPGTEREGRLRRRPIERSVDRDVRRLVREDEPRERLPGCRRGVVHPPVRGLPPRGPDSPRSPCSRSCPKTKPAS